MTSQARRDAQADGWTKYTAEAPCFRGHAPVRYTSSGVCVECLRMRQSTKPRPSLPLVTDAAASGAPRTVTLQLDVPPLDVRYVQVCAALLAHPTQARLLRAFLDRNQAEVRGNLPGSILKRI